MFILGLDLRDRNDSLLVDEIYFLDFYGNHLVGIFTADVPNTREADQPGGVIAKDYLLANIVCAMEKAAFDLTAE
jgi:hypothetical protein